MKFRPVLMTAALVALPLAIPAAAPAHIRVVSATPAQGATVARPRRIVLVFSAALLPPTAATRIVRVATPGMAKHAPIAVRDVAANWSNGNRTMTLSLRQPLRPGHYAVEWQAAGADGHRMNGTVDFVAS